MTQPHEQRCETCEYYRYDRLMDEDKHCQHRMGIFRHDMQEITEFEFDRIRFMGCASWQMK